MIITFCGHKDFLETDKLKKQMLNIIKENANNESVDFYLGGYGRFDAFALSCCKEYKKTHPKSKIILILPYLNESYLKNKNEIIKNYTSTIYPLTCTPQKFAIIKRNYWMAKHADIVIGFVKYNYGGAYKMLNYAKKQNKKIINLAE